MNNVKCILIKLNGDVVKRFFINGCILTITAFIMRAVSMAFNIYVSNKIGAEAVGIFGLVMSVYLFFVTFATSGLSLACTYLVSEKFAKNEYSEGVKVVKNCTSFGILLGLTSSMILISLANIISDNWLNSQISPVPFYLIAIGLPFIALSAVIKGYFSAVRKAYKSAFSQVIELSIKIFISIFLLKFYPISSVEIICIYLIMADVISEVFSGIILFVLYKFDIRNYLKRNISLTNFKKVIFKITFPVSITSYIRSGLSTFKQFIVPNRLLMFGLPYGIALSEYGKITGMALPVIMFPIVFISSFSSLIVPEFSSLLAKGYKKRIITVTNKIFLITSLFSIIVTIFLLIFANDISLSIFQNIDCAKYIKLLSPLVLFMYLDNIIDNMLKGLNKQFQVMFCNIVDLILSICILYFLLPEIGITGFVISIYISEIFNFIVSYVTLKKIIK